jgi:hypothetical protein
MSIVGRVGAGVEVVADNVAQCLVWPLTTPRRQPSSSADPRWALLNRLSITRDERLTQWPRRRQFSLGGVRRGPLKRLVSGGRRARASIR